jgi:type I restriction enzyme M protein
VLFRGNAEADIRRALVRKGYIKGIIGLPANLFYGTGIPACIIVIDKEEARTRKGIFMIDASAGFMKDGPKNRLRAQDIHRIVDVFTRQAEVPKYSRMVSFEEIEKNEFNLNLPRYIDSQQAEDLQDIEGHLHGGIPCADIDALERYWNVCPQLRQTLFQEIRPGYLELAVDKAAIKSAIYEHPEFAAFTACMNEHFDAWRATTSDMLRQLEPGFYPKEIIAGLSEGLLAHYSDKPLINRYDVYQHLMDYWEETMQDDCYLISDEGWKAETSRIIEKDKKGKEKDKGWTCDLVPKSLIVAHFFSKEQEAIDKLVVELESITSLMAELEEEHGGEEGAFSELERVNKTNVTARLKDINGDKEAEEEAAVLNDWLKLSSEEADLKKSIREAEADLDSKAYNYYPGLTEDEIKTLVVEDKWLSSLDSAIHGEMDRISQSLTQRVKELAERYETPMPQMTERVAELEEKVNRHLERMGFKL